jgi:signal peptidase II
VNRSSRPALLGTFALAAAFAFGLDRLTKLLAERRLAGRAPITLIPHVLDLRYTTNSGGAFGVLGSQPWIFFTATVVVSAAIVLAAARVDRLASEVALGLIVGGALGNLADRILHGSGVSGQVTDFIHLHHWPVFNAADSCIVVGAVLVAALTSRRRRDPA